MGRAGRAAFAALVLASAIVPTRGWAQGPRPIEEVVAAPPKVDSTGWKRTVEAAANLLLGAEPQTVVSGRARVARADSVSELGLDLRYTYGAATRDDERVVTQRSWLSTFTLDGFPFSRHSPFLLALAESSLERRIALRASAGLGHKVTFVRTDDAKVSFSLAMIAERTRTLARTEADSIETVRLARWSARLRAAQTIGSRGSLNLESYYRPALTEVGQFTMTNSASVGYKMTSAVQVKVSYRDDYDTEAQARGAESGYEGQLLFGVQADF
jgi:hypothetical protein